MLTLKQNQVRLVNKEKRVKSRGEGVIISMWMKELASKPGAFHLPRPTRGASCSLRNNPGHSFEWALHLGPWPGGWVHPLPPAVLGQLRCVVGCYVNTEIESKHSGPSFAFAASAHESSMEDDALKDYVQNSLLFPVSSRLWTWYLHASRSQAHSSSSSGVVVMLNLVSQKMAKVLSRTYSRTRCCG